MAGDASTVQPTNKILVDSINKHVTTKNVETGTNVYPGRLVMVGTNDDDVIVCDGSTSPAIGWVGYNDTPKKYRPATIATVHSSGDKTAVVWGPGMRLLAKLNTGCTITVGDLLTASANGTLTEGTAGTHDIIATAEEAVTTTYPDTANIIVRSRI